MNLKINDEMKIKTFLWKIMKNTKKCRRQRVTLLYEIEKIQKEEREVLNKIGGS
jgi:hypothetical protein